MPAPILKKTIPSREPETHSDKFRRMAALGLMGMVLVSFAMANLQSIVWTASDWMVSTILPAVIVTETNKERAADQLEPLVRNAVLDEAATRKAEHMAAGQYFAHFSPNGVSPWYWFDQVEYSFVHAGENLAIFFTDSSEIVEAWMDSPTHRANILDANYREIGIGTAKGTFDGYDTVYVVQLFGTPAATIMNEAVARELSAAVEEPQPNASVPPQVAGISDREEVITAPSRAEPEATQTQVGMADDETLVLYSDHAATSTGNIAAPVMGSADANGEPPSFLKYATQPNIVLQAIYILIACFVFIMLLMSISVDLRRERTIGVLYSVALLVLMLALFQVHTLASGGALIA